MLRGILALVVGGLVAVGGIYAEEIKATFVKVDGKKLTVKVGDAEKTYTVDEKAMIKPGKDKDEIPLTEALTKAKEGSVWTLTVEKDVVTKAKRERKQDKKKESN